MGINAITHRDDGAPVPLPQSSADWQPWVSPGRTRNWMLGDPLVDWLQMYGASRGYRRDHEMNNYDPNLDFVRFIMRKGREFEAAMLRLLQEQYPVCVVVERYQDIRRRTCAETTFAVMQQGVPIIYQPVLWDAANLTYGSPDFLIRSDVLRELFPNDISEPEAARPAPDLPAHRWHYLVVDTKFTTLHLNAAGTQLANSGSAPAYKAQLYIYNRMLGRLQGFEPPASFLLGRGWELTRQGQTHRGSDALERLGRIPQDGKVAGGVPIADEVTDALAWVRRLRAEGQHWQLLPEPSVPELYPNLSGVNDDTRIWIDHDTDTDEDAESPGHWASVTKWLADELKELTQLWQVGVAKRRQAHQDGIRRWDTCRLTPQQLGVNGATTAPTLARILAVNTGDGPPVLPAKVARDQDQWRPVPGVEFYVDFEYCSDLNDDFSQLPAKGGQPLIFMIGCGHLENGAWQFRSLVTNHLSEAEELRIIREWVAHMDAVRDRLAPQCDRPRIFHWSSAEVTALERAYNSARARHGAHADWPELAWYDLLQRVVRTEPLVVRGALGFGLKAVARALRRHNLIATDWNDSPVDGLGAMVGAWHCDAVAQQQGVPMTNLCLMRLIADYNEVDCKVMMEIVRYLRAHH